MSETIDTKVASLKLDTKEFEPNVDKAITSLDKLNKSIDFSNHQKGGKGLEALSQTIKGSDLSGMEKSVGLIADRFSNMGIVGVTALQNITNKAVDAGERLLKSLTIDPVKSGFNEYELKMNSMKTILASTRDEFANEKEAIEGVNQKLNELNTYSDKTIYSFSDMTNNIGKFTNAGVDLDTAVQAIKGVSNEAAISGANAQEASRAMYNFSQALSAGYVKLIDWKSIENANMATREFKEQLVQTAVATGELTKKGDQYITSTGASLGLMELFNDGLKDRWMTTEVLTQTLNQYATSYKDLKGKEKDAYLQQLKSVGYTDAQIKKIIDLGERAQAAASEINTWSKLVDTLQEAAQSGWARTFELLFGDLKEATALWTALGDGISNVINATADARNNMLQGWKDAGGRVALINGLANTVKYLGTLLKPIGKAFREIFPPSTGVGLAAASLRFEAFTKTLKASKDTIKNVKDTFKGLFSVLGLVKDVIGGVISVIIPATRSAGSFGSAIFAITGGIGRFLSSGVEFIRQSGIIQRGFEVLAAIVRGIVSIIGKATSKMVSFVTSITSMGNGAFTVALFYLSKFANILSKSLGFAGEKISKLFAKKVSPNVQKFGEHCEKSKRKVQTLVKENEHLNKASSAMSSTVDKARMRVADFGKETAKSLKKSGAAKAASSIKDKFIEIGHGIKDAFSKMAPHFANLGRSLKDLGGSIGGVIMRQFRRFIDFIKSLHILDNIGVGVDKLSARIELFASKIDFAHRPLDSFRKALSANVFFGFAKGTEEANKKLDKTGKKLNLFERIKSKIEEFKKYLDKKGVIDALLKFKDKIAEILNNGIDRNIDRATGLTKIFGMIKLISQSGQLTTSAAAVLKGLGKVTEAWAEAVKNFGEVFKSVGNLINQFAKTVNSIGDLAKTAQRSIRLKMLQTIAISIALLAGSLYLISKIPLKRLKSSVAILGGIIGALVTTMLVLTRKSVDDKKLMGLAASLAALSGAIFAITLSAKMLSSVKPTGLIKAALALAAYIGILIGAGHLASKDKKSMLGLLSLSAAVALLIPTILMMSTISIDTLLSGGAAIFSFVVMMGLAGRAAGKDKAGMAAFIGMAAAIIALVPAILLLAALPLDKALKAVSMIGLLMMSIGLAVRTASQWGGKGAASIAVMGGVVVALTGALLALTLIPFGKLLKSVLALAGVMTAFSLAVSAMGQVNKSSVLVLMGMMTMISGLVYMVASMNAESAVRALLPIGIFISSMGVTVALLSKVGGEAVKALPGLGVIGIIIGVLESLFVAMAALNEWSGDNTVIKALKKAAEIGPLIGKAIGGFAGALVGSFTAEALAGIGKGLSNFMKELKPFLEGAKEIDSDVAAGVKNLAAAVLYLTGANILDKINKWLSSGSNDTSSLSQFAEDLGEFTSVYVKMAKKAGNLKDDQLSAGKKMAETLKEFALAAQEIPPMGGIAKKIFGQKDLQSFADKVQHFATVSQDIASAKFAKGWKGKLLSMATVVKELGQAAQEIPENTTSVKSIIVGMKDLGNFGDQLAEFAPKLKAAMGSLGGKKPITKDSIAPVIATADAVSAMGRAADKIPTDMDPDSLKSKITGVKSLPDFADGMTQIGDKIPDLINASKGMNKKSSEKITLMADVIKKMASAAKTIQTISGGDKSARMGESTNKMINSLASFTGKLSGKGGFVSKFKAFANSASGIDESKLKAADIVSASIKKVSKAAKTLSEIKGSAADTKEKLEGLASGLKTYADKVNGLEVDNVEANTAALKDSLKSATTALKSSNKSFKNSAATSISTYTKSLNSQKNVSGAGTAAASVRKAAVEALGKTKTFSDAGGKVAQAYISALGSKGKKSSASSAGSALAGSGRSGASSVSFYNAGKSGAQGFASGLKDKDAARAVTDAGTYLGRIAKQAAKKEIKSNSPSKEFMKIGRDGTLGFAIGLLDYADKVYNASSKVGESALKGASDSIINLDSALGNPSIKPVVDLSDVERGADRMNSILTNSAMVDGSFINGAVNRQNGDKTEEVVSKLGSMIAKTKNSEGPKEVYNIGDVSLDVSNLDDVVKLGDFVTMLKQAKAIS